MTSPSKAIIGNLSIEVERGTVLTAPSDLQLAWKWAEHVHGADWEHMTHGTKCNSVAQALASLREAYATAE